MNTPALQGRIGVFDSGVGGLTVLRAIRSQLPAHKLLYVADTQHMPYGERDTHYITERCIAVSQYLHQQDVSAIVVACNTASVVAIKTLREHFDVPIVGIEPAIKPAAKVTRSGVVGVLATSATLQSPGVQRLCELYGKNVEIILTPCPGLVERIEQGQLDDQGTRDMLVGFLNPMIEAGADTVVLGCTHYPFVRDAIQDIVGNTVTVVEPGAAVARQLCRRLDEFNIDIDATEISEAGESETDVNGTDQSIETFYSTGQVGDVGSLISTLWGRSVAVRYLEGV